jgi:hypothetical protein
VPALLSVASVHLQVPQSVKLQPHQQMVPAPSLQALWECRGRGSNELGWEGRLQLVEEAVGLNNGVCQTPPLPLAEPSAQPSALQIALQQQAEDNAGTEQYQSLVCGAQGCLTECQHTHESRRTLLTSPFYKGSQGPEI